MSFISVPLKKTYDIDLVKPLTNCINTHYSSKVEEDTFNFTETIENLNTLRASCTSKSLDVKHESSLELIEKYYDQLSTLDQKCPQNELHLSFKWKDAFEKKSSFLSSNSSLSVSSLAYEKCCILFNIASIKSQIGAMLANEGINNDVSLKLAANYFQAASGIYQALKHLTPSLGQELTSDLSSDVLNVLHLIMLAQAQELFFYKASNDNMKDIIIVRVANQCQEYYTETLKQLPILKLAGIDKDWSSIITMKQFAFQGITEYYQAQICLRDKEFGEEIARLEKSIEWLKTAESRGGTFFTTSFKALYNKANRLYEEAKKDNDFIYHARIPDYKSLATIGKASLVKPIPIPEKFRPNIPNPFDKLLPLLVQQAAQKLESRRQELVNNEITTLRDLTQVLNGILVSLNLPASLEDANGVQLPPSIKEKAEHVRSNGGIKAIEQLINDLPDLLKRNKEILEVTERSMKAEEEADRALREKFKEKWTPVASSQLNKSFYTLISKYHKIIENAINADEKIKHSFNSNKEMMQLLSSDSDTAIVDAIPKGSGSSANALNSPHAAKLKELMKQVEDIKQQREAIESGIKNASFDDMKSKFYTQIGKDGSMNQDVLIQESLAQVYLEFQRQIRESKTQQEKLIEEIQSTNLLFTKEKSGNSADISRNEYLTRLAAAHEAFVELKRNLADGIKFYNDLTNLLVNLQGKIDDFNFARKAEREEKCQQLQNDIASQSSPLPTNVPAYHTTDSGEKPPRPPPPQTSGETGQPSNVPAYPYPQQYPPNVYQPYYYPPPPLPQGYNPFAVPFSSNQAPMGSAQQPQQTTGYPYPYPTQPNAPSYPYPH